MDGLYDMTMVVYNMILCALASQYGLILLSRKTMSMPNLIIWPEI